MIVSLTCCLSDNSRPAVRFDSEGLKREPVSSSSLERTKVIPYIRHQRIEQGVNYVYCPAFQLAWNMLCENIIHEEVEIEPETELAGFLNKRYFTKEQLSEGSFVALAGYASEGIVETINNELKKKFTNPPVFRYETKDPREIITYSYMFKELSFAVPFEGEHDLTFDPENVGVTVEAFGFMDTSGSRDMKSQAILEYRGNRGEEFILSIRTENHNDELILAVVAPAGTIEETYDEIMQLRANDRHRELMGDVVLLIPKIMINVEHRYDELKYKHVLNFGDGSYFFAENVQTIVFVLNERGAIVESQSALIMAMAGPEAYIFNESFMLIMKEKDKTLPYLVLWIANEELLMKKEG